MPGNASTFETAGQPNVPTIADFSMLIVGYAPSNPVSDGQITTPYSVPGAAASDLGCADADGVGVLCQAITKRPDNPVPPPACFYRTPATNAGSYGTIDVSAFTGTAVPANNTAVSPMGRFQPRLEIIDGGTVGTTGMTAYASLNGGRHKRKVSLGTKTYYNFPATDGWGIGGQAGISFEPPAAGLSALYTKTTLLQTTLTGTGHFVLTTSSTHLTADTARDTALAAVPAATTRSTAITLFNAIRTYLLAHGNDTAIHTIADTALAAAIAAIPVATTIGDVDLHLPALIAAYNAHRILTTGTVHGAADNTNTITAYVATAGTMIAGDIIAQTTVGPQWDVDDLYDVSDPLVPVGAFAAAAESSTLFSTIVITEPVGESAFSTLVAGLNYGLSRGKLWTLIVRFRDPNAGETDSDYITAFQAFADANHDDRIVCLAGDGWLTDAFTGRVYLRSFMAAYIARWQSTYGVSGELREKLAQNLGWVKRQPLSDFTVRDSGGNPVGHDESVRGGIEGTPGAATGRGVACCYRDDVAVPGTYITNRGSTMYPVLSTVVTPQDRRVVNAVRQTVRSIMLAEIGSADIVDDDGNLDDDIRTGIDQKAGEAIERKYRYEFQNATDPGLVKTDAAVVTSGAQDTITGEIAMKLYTYKDTLQYRVSVTR